MIWEMSGAVHVPHGLNGQVSTSKNLQQAKPTLMDWFTCRALEKDWRGLNAWSTLATWARLPCLAVCINACRLISNASRTFVKFNLSPTLYYEEWSSK